MKVTPKFSPNAQTLLCKRYLRKGTDFPVCPYCDAQHEDVEEMFERASFGREDFYNLLASLDFLPNSPTLFNAERDGTLSACFKFDVQDSMDSILEVGRKSALVQKWGGGVGYCLSELRPKGAHIRSTQGRACGPVAVMRYYHAIAEMITQGGKREGAQMAILYCDHEDIEEFIHCKSTEGVLDTFNISVAATDEFMGRVIGCEKRESELFEEIVKNAWSNGDPGLYFIDAAERANPTPWLGKLTGCNPCGEVPLLDNESCNLGSIDLAHFVNRVFDEFPGTRVIIDAVSVPNSLKPPNEYVDWNRLKETVRLAVRYLDLVIENNFYPAPEIKEATLRTRKLGLGVMGWADALALMRIPYESQEAVGLAEEVMWVVKETAYDESKRLCNNTGLCPAFVEEASRSRMDDDVWRRNACLTCIAPTGSISTLANCSSGIEPHYSLDYTQIMGDGTKLQRKLDFGDFIPKTAHEVDWSWHVKHQAVFQKYTDLAVSKTINMPNGATIEDVRNAYILAWESGCKGITVYREGSRVKQALEVGTRVPDKAFPDGDYDALVHKFRVGDIKGWLHWGLRSLDGKPGEVFITASKQGSTVNGLLDAVAILISIALQSGVPLEELVDKMRGRRFEPSGLTGNPEIPTASSILDYVARYAQAKFLNTHSSYNSGMICPSCGVHAISQSGCLVCSEGCGWSRC